jgi:hypothetical protein
LIQLKYKVSSATIKQNVLMVLNEVAKFS